MNERTNQPTGQRDSLKLWPYGAIQICLLLFITVIMMLSPTMSGGENTKKSVKQKLHEKKFLSLFLFITPAASIAESVL